MVLEKIRLLDTAVNLNNYDETFLTKFGKAFACMSNELLFSKLNASRVGRV